MNEHPKHKSGLALVTGATGLLGSHIAEQLRRRGTAVRALCRTGSDTSFLTGLGVEIVSGDLDQRESLVAACKGADVVYHAAARVGDWGPWEDFVRVTIEGTRNLLEASEQARVGRFLQISSISTYGHPNGEGMILDETAPAGVNLHKWSYYSRAKVEADRLVMEKHRQGRIKATIMRPAWMYGQRDRATLPRVIDKIRSKKVKLLGGGNNRLNIVHAANVAEGVILAAESDRAIGEAYNCCHDGAITQREFFNAVARAIGEPEITATVPYSVAYNAAFLMECFGHLVGRKKPPLVTRYAVWLMGRRCFFECEKIKKQLGWQSTISYEKGIPAAVQDILEHHPRSGKKAHRDSVKNERELVNSAS